MDACFQWLREGFVGSSSTKLPMAAGTGNHFLLALMTFAGSFFAAGLYALLRFQLGSGLRTSAVAGSVYWLMS
jgi:hypothetical protein